MVKRPRLKHSSKILRHEFFDSGSFVVLSETRSMPMNRPAPRTSPTKENRSTQSTIRLRKYSPTRWQFSTSASSSIILREALAAAAASGFPPLLDEDPEGSDQGLALAISSVEIIPLIGKPPPNCFPIVTTSPSTPECQSPQHSL